MNPIDQAFQYKQDGYMIEEIAFLLNCSETSLRQLFSDNPHGAVKYRKEVKLNA
jgi:hypothetical protein